MELIGAKYHIHKGKALIEPVGHILLLHHAAANSNAKGRVLVLLLFQGPHVAKDPLFRVLPDAAGIEQDKICLLLRRGRLKPCFTQHACQLFAVMVVHLAAVGFDIITEQPSLKGFP